jgi:hypothetical protein
VGAPVPVFSSQVGAATWSWFFSLSTFVLSDPLCYFLQNIIFLAIKACSGVKNLHVVSIYVYGSSSQKGQQQGMEIILAVASRHSLL